MKKSDLKDGMVVKYRKGERRLVRGSNLVGIDSYNPLHMYNEDLTDREYKNLDIVQIYDGTLSDCSLKKLLTTAELKLLWQRDETDWSKVPFGTKVRVWDFENDDRLEGKFLGYNEGHGFPYNVFVDVNKEKIWKYCELIEEPVTYGELKKGFDNYCEGRGCTGCKYKTNTYACEFNYILQNYNVTRK